MTGSMTVDSEQVPADDRVLGLDRRTFAPAIIALGICLALIYGWKAVDAALPWSNLTPPGAVLDLGGGATAVAPVGWQLQSGTYAAEDSANPTSLDVVLVKGGTTIELRGLAFAGTAEALLAQVQRAEGESFGRTLGPKGTVVTTSGLVGVSQARYGPSVEVLDVGFKMATGAAARIDAAPGLVVQVRTQPGQFGQDRQTVTRLLSSITPGPDA